MHSASQEQIQSFVDGVGASIAVLQKNESNQEIVIACNSFF